MCFNKTLSELRLFCLTTVDNFQEGRKDKAPDIPPFGMLGLLLEGTI